jgi:hypothetical protein
MMIIALSCRRCNKGRRCHGYADNFGAIGCVVAAESCRWARRAFEADPSHPTAGSPSTGGGIEDALAAMSDRMDDSRARCPAKVTASEDSRYQPRLDQTTTRVRLRWLREVRQMSAIGTNCPSPMSDDRSQSGGKADHGCTGRSRSGGPQGRAVDAPVCTGTSTGISNKPLCRFRGRIGMCLRRSREAAWRARWTRRGPSGARFQSEFVSKIKGWTHRTHLRPSFLHILSLRTVFQVYCVHCVHIRGFAGFWGSMVRPLCVQVRSLKPERPRRGGLGFQRGAAVGFLAKRAPAALRRLAMRSRAYLIGNSSTVSGS